MPWFPDFVSAGELARRQDGAAGRADPVTAYLMALQHRRTRELDQAWPAEVVIFDPRAGEVRGHRRLREYVRSNESWLAERSARTETVARTAAGRRAVVELMAYLREDGQERAWPVAVVADSADDRSVVFRSYCSQWPIDGQHRVRPPVLSPAPVLLTDSVARFLDALEAGDTDAVVSTFDLDGYVRNPAGPGYDHHGSAELRQFYSQCFSAGGGIGLQHCAVTDDGVRCAVEYNCVRWGSHELPPQAGIAVFERGRDGTLAAARIYDDVEPPI
jgi:limonene-1,2-epoxide hydrolase